LALASSWDLASHISLDDRRRIARDPPFPDGLKSFMVTCRFGMAAEFTDIGEWQTLSGMADS